MPLFLSHIHSISRQLLAHPSKHIQKSNTSHYLLGMTLAHATIISCRDHCVCCCWRGEARTYFPNIQVTKPQGTLFEYVWEDCTSPSNPCLESYIECRWNIALYPLKKRASKFSMLKEGRNWVFGDQKAWLWWVLLPVHQNLALCFFLAGDTARFHFPSLFAIKCGHMT